jgi:cytochrome c
MSFNRIAAAALCSAGAVLATAIGAGAARADDADTAKAFHQWCARCHNEKAAGTSTYGPSLAGVVGRKAAQVAGYAYSDALKTSGLVWDEPTLRNWMAANDSMVPGTRMRHVGVENPKDQDAIIAYLKALK